MCALRSDVFGDFVGQLQMASIATISVEAGGREVGRQEVMAKLAPIQQVRPLSEVHVGIPVCGNASLHVTMRSLRACVPQLCSSASFTHGGLP